GVEMRLFVHPQSGNANSSLPDPATYPTAFNAPHVSTCFTNALGTCWLGTASKIDYYVMAKWTDGANILYTLQSGGSGSYNSQGDLVSEKEVAMIKRVTSSGTTYYGGQVTRVSGS